MEKSKGKRVWDVVSTVLVTLVVLCAAFLMGSRIFGFNVYTIISGSMEPTYRVGDLIYVQKVSPATIKEGDPVTFVLNENLVVATHRVMRVDSANQLLYTKGDANEVEDASPVHFNNVIGVPRFRIPKLGYVSDFIQNPPGMYFAIALVAVLLIITFIPSKKAEPAKAQAASAQPAAPAAPPAPAAPAQPAEPAQPAAPAEEPGTPAP